MLPPVTPSMAQARSERLAKKAAGEILPPAAVTERPPNNPINDVESKGWPKISAPQGGEDARQRKLRIGCGQCASSARAGISALKTAAPSSAAKVCGRGVCLQYCPKKAINLGGISVRRARYHNPNVSAKELSGEGHPYRLISLCVFTKCPPVRRAFFAFYLLVRRAFRML